MIQEIERNQPNLDIADLPRQADLAHRLWEDKGALEDGGALARELTQLLEELAPSINDWDQDRRDAAVSLVEALAGRPHLLPALNTEQQIAIARSYVSVVSQLKPEADWLGPPWSALELGQQVADILGKETDFALCMRQRGELSEAWSNYAAKVSFDNLSRPFREQQLFRQSFRSKLDKLQKSFLSKDAEAVISNVQRNGPENLMPAARELTVWYGERTRQGASAKLPILRTAPEYMESLKQKGVDIAEFWNLSNPEQAQQALDVVMADPLTAKLFASRFKVKTGTELSETTDAERRALADLNLDLITNVYTDLYVRRTSYEQLSQRIMDQVSQAALLDNPRQKLKPIRKWLRQVEPGFSSYDAASIQEFIESHEAELRAFHEQKQAGLNDILGRLEDALPAGANYLKFMDRGMFDLKSANLTADCTAWNLNTGFNAWTVPVWVTNPGFNFAYIYTGNHIAAKLGLILAFDEAQKPQVIIDSIETNKNLTAAEDAAALEAIHAGMMELQQWADRRGFGTLQVCTFTNSQELTANLPIIDNQGGDRQLAFDGLRATDEILRNLNLPAEKLPPIYLQSAGMEDDDDEVAAFEHGDYVEGAETFEQLATLALERSDTSRSSISRNDLLEFIRSGDRDLILDGLLSALAPDFVAAFPEPIEHDVLKQLYDNCREEARDRNESLESIFLSALDNLLNQALDEDAKGQKHEDDTEDYSVYDDEELFEEHLSDLMAEKELERWEKAYKEYENEQSKAAWLIPHGLVVDNRKALRDFIEDPWPDVPGHPGILEIFEQIFGTEDFAGVDILKAAKYVFGVPGAGNQETVMETEASSDETIIKLREMPLYDRQKMTAEPK